MKALHLPSPLGHLVSLPHPTRMRPAVSTAAISVRTKILFFIENSFVRLLPRIYKHSYECCFHEKSLTEAAVLRTAAVRRTAWGIKNLNSPWSPCPLCLCEMYSFVIAERAPAARTKVLAPFGNTVNFIGATAWRLSSSTVLNGLLLPAGRLPLGINPSRLWSHTVEFIEPTLC